jgi:small subunit ribosomal protein S16
LLRIRLTRVGKRKQPAYRLVVADSRSPRDGSFLKIIGHYNPLTDPATLVVKEDEAVHWLEKGAKPSETVAKLLTRIGVMERAGKLPVRYEGKAVPPAPKKEAKAEPVEPKPAAAKAVEPEAQAPAAPTAEAESSDAAEPEAPAKTPPEPAAEAEQTEAETTPEEEPEAKEADVEPEATNDEQPQE